MTAPWRSMTEGWTIRTEIFGACSQCFRNKLRPREGQSHCWYASTHFCHWFADCMFNYLSKFMPNMATVLKPVIEHMKDCVWSWGPAQQKAFDSAKMDIATMTALGGFDPKKKTVLSAASSSYGHHVVEWRQAYSHCFCMQNTNRCWAQVCSFPLFLHAEH